MEINKKLLADLKDGKIQIYIDKKDRKTNKLLEAVLRAHCFNYKVKSNGDYRGYYYITYSKYAACNILQKNFSTECNLKVVPINSFFKKSKVISLYR